MRTIKKTPGVVLGTGAILLPLCLIGAGCHRTPAPGGSNAQTPSAGDRRSDSMTSEPSDRRVAQDDASATASDASVRAQADGATSHDSSAEDLQQDAAAANQQSNDNSLTEDRGAKTPAASDQTSLPPRRDGESAGANDETGSTNVASSSAGAPDVETDAAVVDAATADPSRIGASEGTSSERFLLCAPSGPLVFELRLSIDGLPHDQVFARLVDDVLKMADTNGDGRATWDETLSSPRFRYGQLGNLPVNNDNDRRQILDLYDLDNDGLFDRSEAPRFLTRNAGGSRPFSLSSSNEHRRANRFNSPLLRWLDTDESGSLTADEFADAAARMRTRDTNEDELVFAGDFRQTSNQAAAMISNRRRVSEPETAFLLAENVLWEAMLFSLEEMYAFGGRLRADRFSNRDELFRAVDENSDGVWQRNELPELLAVPPHVILVARFGRTDTEPNESTTVATPAEDSDLGSNTTAESDASTDAPDVAATAPPYVGPALELHSLDPALGEIGDVALLFPGRISLRLPEANIEIFVNDMVAALGSRDAIRAQFNRLDADNNGYLDRDEYPDNTPAFQVPFEGIDADGNDQVTLDEVAAIDDQRQGAIRSQIRARAADQEDSLFTALDADGDGRLNLLETRRSPETLASLDRNQDGRLAPSEIPPCYVVGLVRGDPQGGDNLFVVPTAPPSLQASAPSWFVNMDANGDGFVSAREFLGSDGVFASSDADGDGLMSADEAAAINAPAALPASDP